MTEFRKETLYEAYIKIKRDGFLESFLGIQEVMRRKGSWEVLMESEYGLPTKHSTRETIEILGMKTSTYYKRIRDLESNGLIGLYNDAIPEPSYFPTQLGSRMINLAKCVCNQPARKDVQANKN